MFACRLQTQRLPAEPSSSVYDAQRTAARALHTDPAIDASTAVLNSTEQSGLAGVDAGVVRMHGHGRRV
jgi:hypothetical protein